MPGQFINNSNSGGVTFKNNSNSGQAIFSLNTSPVITLYVDLNSGVACSGLSAYDLPTYSYTGTATLCGCTSLNAANAVDLSVGTWYVSDQTNTRPFTSTGGGSTLLTAAGACVAC